MGAGNQGCCSGKDRQQEVTLEQAARNGSNGTTSGSKEAFFKRQSTALDIAGSLSVSNEATFYGNLVISCTGRGECHSKFSKLCLTIQQNVGSGTYDEDDDDDYDDDDRKDSKFTEEEKQIIREKFRYKGDKLREYFILLLEKTENDDKYTDLYDNLDDDQYKVDANNARFILNQFIKIVKNNDEYLLQCLANFTCTFGSRPLWNEILENVADNDDLNEEAILEKVEEVHKSEFFLQLKQKDVELADNEILAVYIYTVNAEFADLMQKNLKIPCKWKQTFYYFVRGILKIYDAVVYKQKSYNLPQSLYHPIFGQTKISAPFQMLFTINCTSSEKQAKEVCTIADGTMYVFENVSAALSKGKLIAAPIQWISPDPTEEEWVILPLKILKIQRNKQFDVQKNCKQVTIKKYESFSIDLYGVDVFGKLGDLKIVKELKAKNQKYI